MESQRPTGIALYRALRPLKILPLSDNADAQELRTALTVMSYNVLAQHHIWADSFPHCHTRPPHVFRWTHRRACLTEELRAYDADICGLQEAFKWHEYFAGWFDAHGYSGRFVEKRGGADGCALTWRRSRFELLSYDEFDYEQAMREEGLDGDVKPNVGQIAVLCDRVTQVVLAVANTHLYWKRDCERVRLKQMHYLRSRIKDPTMPLVLLGGAHAAYF